MGERYFDDFEVGQHFDAGSRTVTQADLATFTEVSGDDHPIHWDEDWCRSTPFGRPILHGPLGIAMGFGQLQRSGIFGESVIAMRSVAWDFLAPVFVGDELSVDMTITRCRPGRQGTTGTVNRWLRLVNQDGVIVQRGMSPVLLQRRPEDASRPPVHGLDFGSVAWAALVAERLAADDAFRQATAGFDGAIGFGAGDEVAHLRVHHGRVLETGGPRLDAARRFAISGSEAEWVDLVFAPRQDYLARATQGRFEVDGDVYEYLRVTKAIDRCWNAIRALAHDSVRGDGRPS